jgi:hypothetical protein
MRCRSGISSAIADKTASSAISRNSKRSLAVASGRAPGTRGGSCWATDASAARRDGFKTAATSPPRSSDLERDRDPAPPAREHSFSKRNRLQEAGKLCCAAPVRRRLERRIHPGRRDVCKACRQRAGRPLSKSAEPQCGRPQGGISRSTNGADEQFQCPSAVQRAKRETELAGGWRHDERHKRANCRVRIRSGGRSNNG